MVVEEGEREYKESSLGVEGFEIQARGKDANAKYVVTSYALDDKKKQVKVQDAVVSAYDLDAHFGRNHKGVLRGELAKFNTCLGSLSEVWRKMKSSDDLVDVTYDRVANKFTQTVVQASE